MKKKYLILSIISLIIIFLLFSKKQPADLTNHLKLWVISDPHFLTEELHDEGSAFASMQQTAAGKDLYYQEDSWQSLVAQAQQEKPDMLVVTGDLTFNGEKQSAEKLKTYFSQLETAGISVLVIPGNHDIHDGWAREFIDKKQIKTEQISTHDFKNIFASSYDQAIDTDPHSLSYVVQATEDTRFLLLDTNIYTVEKSNRHPETSGKIDSNSLQWIETQLEKAKNAQQSVLVFMHHNLLPHNKLITKGFVLNNAEELQHLLSKYEVPLVFSGHTHVQDILTSAVNNITEITTGSFTSYPQVIGELHLTSNDWQYQRLTLDSNQQPSPPGYPSYEDYLKELFFKDGQRFAYSSLLDQGIYDDDILTPIADLVGQANLNLFSGDDYLSDEQIQQVKESNGYRLLEQQNSTFLTTYVQSILQDTTLPDDTLHLQKRQSWQIITSD